MESTRLRSRLSRSLLFQVIFLIAISTWYTTDCEAATTTATDQTTSDSVSTQSKTTTISTTPQTTVQTTTPTPAFPGKVCNQSQGVLCVANATCNISSICQCNTSFYAINDACSPKVAVNQNCSTNESCADPNSYCKTTSCQCTSNFYYNNSACTARLRPGSACNSTNQCVDNANCSFYQSGNGNCTCFDTHYQDKDVCTLRLRPGDVCSNTTQCVQNAICSHGNCTCESTHFADGKGVCKPSLAYGSNCTVGLDNMCMGNLNLTCRKNTINGTPNCLCQNGTFRNINTCNLVNQLKVTNVDRSPVEEKNLNLTWSAPIVGLNLKYKISLNNTDNHVINATYFRFQDKTSGTLYTVSVITSVLRDPGYSTEEESSEPFLKAFYTKPAKPGDLSQDVYQGPNVTIKFRKSDGGVDFYIVNITHSVKGTTQTENVTSQSNDLIAVKFYRLTPGDYYNVIIVAHSGGISSDVTTGHFRVDADLPGEVKNLTVTRNGSREADFEWGIPEMPNGVIIGYTVEVSPENNSTCVSGVTVVCSNCTDTNFTMPDTSKCGYSVNKTQTHDQLQSNGVKQNASVTGLSPFVKYNVTVTPFNEKGAGQMSMLPFQTKSEAAPNLVSLEAVTSPTHSGQLNIRWVPGEKTGNTSYSISWSEESSIGSNNYTYIDSYVVYGYGQETYNITGLLSYWNYRVCVHPFTEIGPSPQENCTVCRSGESTPGEVENFTIYQPLDSAQELQFTVSCPLERQRNGTITFFVFKTTQPDNKFEQKVEANHSCDSSYTFNVTVTAEVSYTFTAAAMTSKGEGPSVSRWWYVAPKRPKLSPSLEFDASLLKGPAEGETSQTTAVVKVCPCLIDRSQGAITMAGLIVCSNDNTNCNINATKEYLTSGVMTWKKFKANGYKGSYRPTPDDWYNSQDFAPGSRRKRSAFLSRSTRATGDDVTYTLGINDTCEQQNSYCNGPLPSNTKLVVKAFACTAGGCSLASISITVTTLKIEGPNVGAIVGGVIGGFAALVLIVLIVVFVMRRRKSMDKPHKYLPTAKSKPSRHPIKLRDFRAHLDHLHSDSNLRFQEEFEDIQERSPKTYTQDAATTDANKVKNRYVNILPYDHTRVKLTTADDDESSDFINANYIPGYSSPREYIATQGPMTGTVDDFWRMIWEQKSGVIVMLSDLQEKGRPKVDLYWPTEPSSPVQYGDVIVELRSSSTLNKYTIRDFSISMQETQEKRKVLQFFIPGWEDYSANLDSDDVLDFVQAVRQQARTSRGPITVHCSAGVGRTGTFIALDFLMQYVNDHDLEAEVDIYNLVLNMRHNRPHMVQSEKQYIFIHDTLTVIIDKKIKAMQENENIYMNTDNADDNIYANTNPAFELEESLYQNSETIWKPTTTL